VPRKNAVVGAASSGPLGRIGLGYFWAKGLWNVFACVIGSFLGRIFYMKVLVLLTAIFASTAAPVTPPPVTGSQPLSADTVFANGVMNWPVDFSYGGLQKSVVADPQTRKKVLQLSTPQGTGGWQPGYQSPWPLPPSGQYVVYDTTGRNFLNISIKVTKPGCTFLSAFLGATDSAIPGANVVTMEKFGPALVVGQWITYKIPLGAAGYNIAGVKVLKFNVQENNPIVGNIIYVDNVFFSAT
jgi:hypothetical protein